MEIPMDRTAWASSELGEALCYKWKEEANVSEWHLDRLNMRELLQDLRDNPETCKEVAEHLLRDMQDWVERKGYCPLCWQDTVIGVEEKPHDPTYGARMVCTECREEVY